MNREIPRVLLTGATGFLGSHLLDGLLQRGFGVALLKRSRSSTARIAAQIPQVSVHDLDRVPLESAFEGEQIVAVIHAATSYGRKGEQVSDVVAANVVLGTKLLELAAAFGVRTFVNTGTFSAKGGELPDGLATYVATKRLFSELGARMAVASGVTFVELVLEHVYGPRDDVTKFVPSLLQALIENRPAFDLTRGEQRRDFVYVGDVVAAYLRVLERRADLSAGLTHRFEVGSGEAVALAEFVRLAREVAGSRTELKFGALPYRAGEPMHSVADLDPLRRLGWEPTVGLRQGLERCVAAVRQVAQSASARDAP
jgi:CDP-paratose synthetase